MLDLLNPPTPTITEYSFDNANRLTTAGGQTYTFDANGNLLSDGENTVLHLILSSKINHPLMQLTSRGVVPPISV